MSKKTVSPEAVRERIEEPLRHAGTAYQEATGVKPGHAANALLRSVYKIVRLELVNRKVPSEDLISVLQGLTKVYSGHDRGLFLWALNAAVDVRSDMALAKRRSRWAAALEYAHSENVKWKDLHTFLHDNGGIEGVANMARKKRAAARQRGEARTHRRAKNAARQAQSRR